MRVMVMVKATQNSEAGVLPDEKLFADMGKFNEELVKAGIMQSGDGLKPSKYGKRVRFGGPKKSVVDGPFAETKELIAGFWILEVKSMDEAVEWMRRAPFNPGDTVDIRPVFELEDFGEALTPEVLAAEEANRAKIEAQHGR